MKLWKVAFAFCLAATSCASAANLGGDSRKCTANAFEPNGRTAVAAAAPPPSTVMAEAFSHPSVRVEDDGVSGRDTRRSTTHPRARALLVTEIQGLEMLLRSTPRDAADRHLLLRRLAEDYVELEHAVPRNETVAAEARRNAIAKYVELRAAFPDYAQMDEVLYYLGREHEDVSLVRKTYLELIQRYPSSPFVPRAYLAFGDLFSEEARADPSKSSLAREAYIKVIGYPPPANSVYGYAWYRLAHVFLNDGDEGKALAAFAKTIEYGADYASLPNAAKLAEMARKDMAALPGADAVRPASEGPES
jgi:tetratricopeptide (TPR) repeat protein